MHFLCDCNKWHEIKGVEYNGRGWVVQGREIVVGGDWVHYCGTVQRDVVVTGDRMQGFMDEEDSVPL